MNGGLFALNPQQFHVKSTLLLKKKLATSGSAILTKVSAMPKCQTDSGMHGFMCGGCTNVCICYI